MNGSDLCASLPWQCTRTVTEAPRSRGGPLREPEQSEFQEAQSHGRNHAAEPQHAGDIALRDNPGSRTNVKV
jgi:hypothetical protein